MNVFSGQTSADSSLVFFAAESGDVEQLKAILEGKSQAEVKRIVNWETKECNPLIATTPLFIACEQNHFEIVKYLTEHGADTDVIVASETYLMRACWSHSKYDMVKCLLDCGADVNIRNRCGRTALHVCAESGVFNNLILLLENGAEYVTDDDGITPLLAAANGCQLHIVEYLTTTNTSKITKQDKVNALELLGAVCLEKDHLGISWTLKYWRLAMELRYEDDKCLLPKPASKSLLGITEANSFAELEAFSSNPEDMRIQALLIRGRILPHFAREMICNEIERYKARGDYDKCIELLLYAFRIKQDWIFASYWDEFHTIIESFEEIIRSDDTECISFESALKVFMALIIEVETTIIFLHKSDQSSIKGFRPYDLLKIVFRTMCTIYSLKPRFGEKFIESEFKSVVYRLVHIEPTGKRGFELLHMVVAFFSSRDNIEFRSLQEELIDLLLEMGADPNECDENNRTPLHSAVISKSIPLFELLLRHGAHLDISSHHGGTPLELARRFRSFEFNLNPLKYLNLQCLCAQAVRKNNIPYKGLVDKNLEIFLDKHGVLSRVNVSIVGN